MPTYTLKNKNTDEQWDVSCSYKDMKAMLTDNIIQVLVPPNFVSNTQTHANSNTSDGWKDLLGRIKKGSSKNNTIKT